MKRAYGRKRALAMVGAFVAAAGFLSAAAAADPAEEQTATDSESSLGYNVNEYSQKLAELAEEQARIESELAEAGEELINETEKQQLVLEKINNINSKIEVVNAYMTQLEIEISGETRQANALKEEIDEGVEAYKKRLRAMYIAGDVSYTEVLLSSGDFFDVLMRSELVKRVADYDSRTLDELVAKKAEYEQKLTELESEQEEYDEQAKLLESERAELAELYNSSKELKESLAEKQQQLEEEQEIFANEIYSYEGILSDLLKGSYGSSDDEAQRLQTELAAADKLTELHRSINARTDAGEVIPDSECRYDFKWPVPGHYYVSSGVGARWGAYHGGLDITGDGGTQIVASEAGEVVRTNNSCTHNYGKSGSCGCGGGYGNFVVIDHGNGFLTLYGHLSQATVEVGDKVSQGEVIGLMGSTGYSTGTHLHFELRYNGYITNPAAFVSY